MAIEETLTKKVGPLPLWGWAAAGAVVFYIYRHHAGGGSAAGLAAAATVTPPTPIPADVIDTSQGGYATAGLGGGSTGDLTGGFTPSPGTGSAATPTQQAAGPVACTPPFPWRWVGGTLVDNVTGHPAYFGEGSQPGTAWTPGQPVPTGMLAWTMPDGRGCAYDPTNWSFADPSRPPICH